MTGLGVFLEGVSVRPPHSHEFHAYSMKLGGLIKVYSRAALAQWITIEFDPAISMLKVNPSVFKFAGEELRIAFSYLKGGQETLTIFEDTASLAASELQAQVKACGGNVNILRTDWANERSVELWNHMEMLSCIGKWRAHLSERDMVFLLQSIASKTNSKIDEIIQANEAGASETLARIFELVRQGRLKIEGLKERRIGGKTRISIPR